MEQPDIQKAIDDNVLETKEMMLQLRLATNQEQYEEIADTIRFLLDEYRELKAELEKFNQQKSEFLHWLDDQKAKYE